MKRRKNAVYKGQSTRVSTGTGKRDLVKGFYIDLNILLAPNDEIEIIPPEQVNPTHSLQEQKLIIANYCTRKILPEVTSLFHGGDTKVTQQLRALKPIVDQETANAAVAAVDAAARAAEAAKDATATPFYGPAARVHYVADAVYTTIVSYAENADNGSFTRAAAACVHTALIVTIDRDDEAAYDRIIDLTNEMLESL